MLFRSILTAFIMITSVTLAQEITITDTLKQEYALGKMSWFEWQQKAGWPDYSAKEYSPGDYIGKIKQSLDGRDISFVIVGASWCGDSKKGMPEIFKMISLLEIKDTCILLIGVDRDKLDPESISIQYGIEKVPTLIVYEEGKELGRIVEIPLLSWHEDLLEILKK